MYEQDEPIGRDIIEVGKNMNDDQNKVNRFWHNARPYWHVLSFVIIMTAICTVNWTKVQQYDARIVALELWRIESSAAQAAQIQALTITQSSQSRDIAVVKQQVEDIHDYLLPKK
jgi:hypothetical protein